MSYCLAILTRSGLVFASDSRTNAGLDRVNVARKTFTFVTPGERAFILLTSGGLSLSQSVVALLRAEFDAGRGLATAATMYTPPGRSGTPSAGCPTSTGRTGSGTTWRSTSTSWSAGR
jgi:predicted proteasome-type protease